MYKVAVQKWIGEVTHRERDEGGDRTVYMHLVYLIMASHVNKEKMWS